MERELEKDLKEIEYLIYVHKNRGNTNTQSVLERVYEIIEPCAKAARTLPDLEELLSRENTPEITRSPRDNDVTEYCPHCDREITVSWNVERDELEKILEEIGSKIAESMGKKREGLLEAENITRKHMNDGWVSVEDRLPEKNEYFVDTSSNKEFPNGYYRRLEIAYMTDTVEYIHGYYDGYKWMDEYLDAIKNVVAWRIHEPYRTERSSDEKE